MTLAVSIRHRGYDGLLRRSRMQQCMCCHTQVSSVLVVAHLFWSPALLVQAQAPC